MGGWCPPDKLMDDNCDESTNSNESANPKVGVSATGLE